MSDPANENIVLPQDCRSMPELRSQIDRLDRALVALIAERLGYIARAAELKTARSAVHDQSRIDDVIAKVRTAAWAHRVDPDFVETIWRTLVDRSIAHEFRLFDAKTPPKIATA